ncbi:MAG: hypothetical protein GC181_08375 [Bacteroidetes bacterium]|nr:hypothetical protein [Bacteroidota bacterium]
MEDNTRQLLSRGRWRTRYWPFAFFILTGGLWIYLAIDGRITASLSLILIGVSLVLTFFWMLYAIGNWKMYAIEIADQPKILMDQARDSFLKPNLLELLSFIGPGKRKYFNEKFKTRSEEVHAQNLRDGRSRFYEDDVIKLHQNTSSVLRLITFELLVMFGIAAFMFYQEELSIRLICVALLILGIIGLYYTIKVLRKKLQTVLEISKRGIRIHSSFYSWSDMSELDIRKGEMLRFDTFASPRKEFDLRHLSQPLEHIRSSILFFSDLAAQKKAGKSS